jgi:phosphatidylglycerophosphate synthase
VPDVLSHAPSVDREAPWTYESALKDPTVEEWINLHLHRRLAFALIRPMQGRFESVSPNHLTLLSGLIGIASGVCCYRSVEHGPHWLALGALLLLLSAVVDCADGMLARLRGQSSELGRLLDGIVDQVVGISAWYGISYAVCSGIDVPGEWVLCTLALFSAVIHVALYDQLKARFAQLTTAQLVVTPKPAPTGVFERGLEALHRNVYGAILRAFGGGGEPLAVHNPAAARRHLSSAMHKATWLGLGTQFCALYVAALLGALTHVWVTFVVASLLLTVFFNAWIFVAIASWKRAEARLRAELSGA